MDKVSFIDLIAPGAKKFQKETGVFASVTIAQACLETGFGKSMPVDQKTGKVSNNVFGVKWAGKGDYVVSRTREEYNGKSVYIDAKFQAYPSVYESLEAHGRLVGYASRYAPVRNAKTAEEQCRQLYKCGYATDSLYASKLISIINTWSLKQYDSEDEDMAKEIEELRRQVEVLSAEVQALKKLHYISDVPTWAEGAVKEAQKQGIINTPDNGSYDFYRFLTILYGLKLFNKKV